MRRRDNILSSGAFAALLFTYTTAFACPSQIVIIRHGEKPDDPKANEVNTQGCERAASLPHFFQTNPTVNQFGAPAAYYAARPAKADSSLRPEQTITPTAARAGKPILALYKKNQWSEIRDDIMNQHPEYTGKTVVISWEHKNIPNLAQTFFSELGPGTHTTPASDHWPGTVFDAAWVIHVNPSTCGFAGFEVLPEAVLPGDNAIGQATWDKKSPKPADQIQASCLPELSQSVSFCQNGNDLLNSMRLSVVEEGEAGEKIRKKHKNE